MDYKSFLLVPCGASHGNYASKKPKLENVQVAMFKRGCHKMFWKTKQSQEQFHEAQFLQNTSNL